MPSFGACTAESRISLPLMQLAQIAIAEIDYVM
jgi:hypothetical protein